MCKIFYANFRLLAWQVFQDIFVPLASIIRLFAFFFNSLSLLLVTNIVKFHVQ